jgi:hypothetical protein
MAPSFATNPRSSVSIGQTWVRLEAGTEVIYTVTKICSGRWKGQVVVQTTRGVERQIRGDALRRSSDWILIDEDGGRWPLPKLEVAPPLPSDFHVALYHLLAVAAIRVRSTGPALDKAATALVTRSVNASLDHLRKEHLPRFITKGLVDELVKVYSWFKRQPQDDRELFLRHANDALRKHGIRLTTRQLERLYVPKTAISVRSGSRAGGVRDRVRERLAIALFDVGYPRKIKEMEDGDRGVGYARAFRSTVNDDGVLRFVLKELFGWEDDRIQRTIATK